MAKKPGRPPPLFRQFVLADLITIGNASFGMGSIFAAISYVETKTTLAIKLAFGLLPLALICDILDGSVARWRKRQSPFGSDLDSLSDVISFGVAPAVMGYALGLRGLGDVLVLIYFVACGVSRLARFNATADGMMTDKGKVSHFEGTPIPTTLLVVAILAGCFAFDRVGPEMAGGVLGDKPFQLHPFVLLYFLSGSLMVSRVRIPKP
ncbi:MAG: CDP-alcohol phosphatidyltransferase family protein [Myxococcota bacterium]